MAAFASEQTVLSGTEWTLRELRGRPPVRGTKITLEIGDGNLDTFAGCNGFGGRYEATDEGKLEVIGLMGTSLGCPDDEMRQETAYLAALDGAAGFRVEDDRLDIRNSEGEISLVYTKRQRWSSNPDDLVNTEWMLSSANGTPALEPFTPTLSFDSSKEYSSYDGCLETTDFYRATRHEITFSNPDVQETVVSEQRAECMKPEALFARGGTLPQEGPFNGAGEYELVPQRLKIRTLVGDVFLFVPLKEGAVEKGPGKGWELEKFVERDKVTPVLEGTEITLEFDDGTLRKKGAISGSAGCNAYSVDYEFINTFDFGDAGIPTVTKKRCPAPAGVMEQEARYLSYLADARRIGPTRDQRLEITMYGGRKLVFVGRARQPQKEQR